MNKYNKLGYQYMFIFRIIQNAVLIAEGYIKWFIDLITFRISKMAKKRLDICNLCKHNKHGICELCGCILKAKARVDFILDENGKSIDGCPELKW